MRLESCVRLGGLLAAIVLQSCRYRPTQVTLLIDSNVASARAATLTVVVLEGAQSVDALRASAGRGRVLQSPGELAFPSSVALVPAAMGLRGGELSLLAALDVAATATQPALRIERVQRVSLIERTPQQARLFFNVACATAASDCAASSLPCTVSQRCIEQGLTCGDDGACVPVALPTVRVPVDVALDATVLDAARPAFDAAESDAGDAAPDAPAPVERPRLIAPASQVSIAATRPIFRWVNPMGATSTTLRACRQRACDAASEVFATPVTGAMLAAPMDLAAGRYYWRVDAIVRGQPSQSPTWQFSLTASTSGVQRTRPAPVDVNGDGFADLVVGAGGNNTVYVFLGSTTGLPNAPSQVLTGTGGTYFGSVVASAGDIDGDGRTDVVVGAPLDSPLGRAQAGRAQVFMGSPSGLNTTPAHTSDGETAGDHYGGTASSAGDVDGDGFGDVVIASASSAPAMGGRGYVRLYHGSARGLGGNAFQTLYASAGTFVGTALAALGDVDGDGYSEVALGDPRNSAAGRMAAGSVSIVGGEASGFLRARGAVGGIEAGEGFGAAVTTMGDIDGDGFADWAASAPLATVLGAPGGAVRVFRGGPIVQPIMIASAMSAQPSDGFGASVACVGAVNGDATGLLIGAPLHSESGSAALGSAHLFACDAPSACAMVVRSWNGTNANERFATSVASPGDLDGNGYDDLLIGTPHAFMGRGRVALYAGTMPGYTPVATRSIEGLRPTDEMGIAIVSR